MENQNMREIPYELPKLSVNTDVELKDTDSYSLFPITLYSL